MNEYHVKTTLSGCQAKIKAKGPSGEERTVIIQNNVPGKAYLNIEGKEAWMDLEHLKQALKVLFGDGYVPKHGKGEQHEV